MKLRITLEGVAYDVEVEVLPERPQETGGRETSLPEQPALPPPPPDIRPEDRICRSPIAGAIVSVAVSTGDRVRKDDTLAIIEAMKMEIAIGAPLDGTVDEINISPGEAVTPGQVLCTLV